MKTFQIFRVCAAKMLLALALAAAPVPALADDAFDGEDITLIVPFAEGGGTDKWARYYAPFIERLYPGRPDVDVENEPGDGGPLEAANDFAEDDHDDGLTILAVSGSNHFPYILADGRVEYDYDDWEVLLVSPIGGVVYASPDLLSSYLELGRLKGQKLKYIAQSPVGLDIVPILAMELLGLKPQAVFGAESRGEGIEEFLDEEVLIDFQTTPAYLEHVDVLARDGDAIPLFSLGILDRNGELKRDPSFPELPHFGEVYKRVHGKDPSGEKFTIWKTLLAAGFSAQKMLFVPKSVDPEILEAHRSGMRAVLADPTFKREAPTVLGRYPQYVDAQARRLNDLALGVNERMRNEIGFWLVTDALPRWTAPE